MNERKSVMVIMFVLGMLGLVILSGCSDDKSNVTLDMPEKSTPKIFETKSTGTTSAGDVLVDLTPHELSGRRLEVDIAVNTHSVDLTQFKLGEMTVLEYGGKTYHPESAPELTGHHSSGTIVFNVDDESSESYNIIIRGIPKTEERTFTWDS